MRKLVLVSLLLFSLAGCWSHTVEEKPVVVQPQPTVVQPPPAANTAVVPQTSAVICPNGVQVPAGAAC